MCTEVGTSCGICELVFLGGCISEVPGSNDPQFGSPTLPLTTMSSAHGFSSPVQSGPLHRGSRPGPSPIWPTSSSPWPRAGSPREGISPWEGPIPQGLPSLLLRGAPAPWHRVFWARVFSSPRAAALGNAHLPLPASRRARRASCILGPGRREGDGGEQLGSELPSGWY